MPGRPIVLRSTQLIRMEAHEAARPSARQVIGWASTGGAVTLSVMQIEDAGSPGSGGDAFALYVGEAAAPIFEGDEAQVCDCADVSYTIEGLAVEISNAATDAVLGSCVTDSAGTGACAMLVAGVLAIAAGALRRGAMSSGRH